MSTVKDFAVVLLITHIRQFSSLKPYRIFANSVLHFVQGLHLTYNIIVAELCT